MICYEVIFPAAVTGPGERPRWLLNVTNDAWFGLSSGPYQHLASARLRAVEEGLPMIRAANTGVSAVIDAYGRVLVSLDMMREGIIDHRPAARRERHALRSLGRLERCWSSWRFWSAGCSSEACRAAGLAPMNYPTFSKP